MFLNHEKLSQFSKLVSVVLEYLIAKHSAHENLSDASGESKLISLQMLKQFNTLNTTNSDNAFVLDFQKLSVIADTLKQNFSSELAAFSALEVIPDLFDTIRQDIDLLDSGMQQQLAQQQQADENFNATLGEIIDLYNYDHNIQQNKDAGDAFFEIQTLLDIVLKQNSDLRTFAEIVNLENISTAYTLQSRAITDCVTYIQNYKDLQPDFLIDCIESIQKTFEQLWVALDNVTIDSMVALPINRVNEDETGNAMKAWSIDTINFIQEQRILLWQIQAQTLRKERVNIQQMQQTLSQQSIAIESLQSEVLALTRSVHHSAASTPLNSPASWQDNDNTVSTSSGGTKNQFFNTVSLSKASSPSSRLA